MAKSVERNRCPACGGEIQVIQLYKHEFVNRVMQSGKLTHKSTCVDGELLDEMAKCSRCDVAWKRREFEVTDDRRFIDHKYGGG